MTVYDYYSIVFLATLFMALGLYCWMVKDLTGDGFPYSDNTKKRHEEGRSSMRDTEEETKER